MKKSWIYVVLIVVIAIGFFYMVLEKPKPVEPDDNVAQEEVEPEETEVEDKVEEDAGPVDSPELGKPLPDFTLKNLDGEDVTLSDTKDKIVLVNFWATWCTWCAKEMPDLQKLKEKNDDLLVLAVNVNETKEAAQKYIKDGGYDFEVLLDAGGTVYAQYLATGLPASYFVDKDGKFVGRVPGMMTYDQMNEILEDIRSQ